MILYAESSGVRRHEEARNFAISDDRVAPEATPFVRERQLAHRRHPCAKPSAWACLLGIHVVLVPDGEPGR